MPPHVEVVGKELFDVVAVPESYGLLEEPPNERIRRSLVLATKILTTMTSGAHFGDKEQFMIQFNELIDKNLKPLAAFYDAVCSDRLQKLKRIKPWS